MRKIARIVFCLLAVAALYGCNPERNKIKTDDKEKTQGLSEDVRNTRLYVNTFGYNVMSLYYLWCDEIKNDLELWNDADEPISKVKKIRYKQDGKDVDRWTQMTDDFEGFTSSVAGVSVTYGYDCMLAYADSQGQTICAIITYVYADSPAEKAGIKRGDIVLLVNGNKMTQFTYVNQVNNEMFGSDKVSLTMANGKVHDLVAVEMYEDPVLVVKTFDLDGKKVGYLHYTSFTLKSCEHLYEAFDCFKKEGIEELILDLRYNGGGYVLTQQFIASALAPYDNVKAGDVLETEVYNKTLAEAWGNESTKLSFKHEIEIDGVKREFDTEPVNLGIKKLYAIISSGSASASESLITCLLPYLPITIVGEQSHGKFCTGIMYGAQDWYDDNKEYIASGVYTMGKKWTDNWGIYVMIGRFADKYGKTPCMPDGFKPDYNVEDDLRSHYQLGNEKEPMLEYTLDLIRGGAKAAAPAKRMANRPELEKTDYQRTRPEFGLYVSPSVQR